MKTIQLTFAAFLFGAVPPEAVLLTPDTIADHGFHLRFGVGGEPDTAAERPSVPVFLRFGTLPGTASTELKAIKDVSLVVRKGNEALLSVPVRTKIDPGNRVHLYCQLSARKELLSQMQLKFDHVGEQGRRTFLVDLKAFIEE